MTGNEYQEAAARTIGCDDPEDACMHGLLGLASETGEVLGLYQKLYQGHEVSPDHLVKELGDCLWMIAEICTAENLQLEDVMQTNIDKLKKRYPDGFDPERSLHRAEGDI